MAVGASGTRNIKRAHIRLVNIRMTVGTFQTDLPECPFVLLFVTGDAGGRQVSALQGKLPGIVLFEGKGRSLESGSGMAVAAVLRLRFPDELPFMVIGMAIRTPVVFDRVGHIGLVARLAGHGPVFVLQRKIGPGMVEVGDPFDRAE